MVPSNQYHPYYKAFMTLNGDHSVILGKAKELCQTIVDQPEFKDLRRRVDAFLADPSAKQQYQQVVDKGEMLQDKQQRGNPLSQAEIQDFEKDREALINNPVAKAFLEAQQEMHELRQSVNQYVSKTFELGRMPTDDDFHGCGSSCSCGGH